MKMTSIRELVLEAARLMRILEDLMTTADILGDVVGFSRYRRAYFYSKSRYARRQAKAIAAAVAQ